MTSILQKLNFDDTVAPAMFSFCHCLCNCTYGVCSASQNQPQCGRDRSYERQPLERRPEARASCWLLPVEEICQVQE